MANNREISQFAGLVTVNDTTNQVSIASTLELSGGGRLGIGTDGPATALDVATSVDGEAVLATFTNTSKGGTNETVDINLGLEGNTTTSNVVLRAGKGANHNSGAATDNFFALFTTADNVSSEAYRVTSAGNIGVNTTNPGAQAWRSGRLLDIHGGAGNVTGELHLGANRGDGVQSVGSINFYDNTQDADHKHIAIIESDKGGSTSNKRGGQVVFYTKSDNVAAPTERLRIDEEGRLLVGKQSHTGDPLFVVETEHASGGIISEFDNNDSDNYGGVRILGGVTDRECRFQSLYGESFFTFYTENTGAAEERVRITKEGDFIINGDDVTFGTGAGMRLAYDVSGGLLKLQSYQNDSLRINRNGNDGILVRFYQANNQEGTIEVSGTTISYNGAHLSRWSQLASGGRAPILRGSVMSNLNEMCSWPGEQNEQLNRMKVSDEEGDVNVAGVFQSWDDEDEVYTNDFTCAMTGDFVIRIAQGTTVARGDLLMSAGDGTAKPQGDDIVRSKTIAKVTSTVVSETYADGSYCVPCVLMAC